MEEPGRSNRFAQGSEVPASGTTEPSESDILERITECGQVNPGARKLMGNSRLVAVTPSSHNGAKDRPPATRMNTDKHTVSAPAAPVATLDISTPERTIPDSSLSQLLPSTTNVAMREVPASVTPQAPGSSTLSPEHTQDNHPFTRQRGYCGRRHLSGKSIEIS